MSGRFCPGWFLSVPLLSEYICYNRKLNITLNFMFHVYDKKFISVTPHALDPSPCHKLSHLLGPSPFERNILYGRPPAKCDQGSSVVACALLLSALTSAIVLYFVVDCICHDLHYFLVTVSISSKSISVVAFLDRYPLRVELASFGTAVLPQDSFRYILL